MLDATSLPFPVTPDKRQYHPHRADGLDRNLTRINEADSQAGALCTCADCVREYEDCRRYKNTLIFMGWGTR